MSKSQRITGRDNANTFINKVVTSEDSIIIMYGDDWSWMCNSEWRNYISSRLLSRISSGPTPVCEFKSIVFSEPDHLDGWTFAAYRKDARLPIALRTLDDTAT
jgi:hypothetical protein